MINNDCAGYISRINVGGKTYKLRCEVEEVHPISCTKCGAPIELHFGEGECQHCGTKFSSRVIVEEV